MNTYKSISQYAENVRYFYDPSSVDELQGLLKSVYVHVKQSPKDASVSLFEIFDKNIRQLLKNLLVYRSFNQELKDVQRTLVLFESIISRSNDDALAKRYLERCRFASEVIGDRINELSADKSKLVSQPQVRAVLALIAKNKKARQKLIQEKLDVSKQRASNILRQMRSASLIDAVSDENDKRERSYVLTDPGKIACSECNISVEDNYHLVSLGGTIGTKIYDINNNISSVMTSVGLVGVAAAYARHFSELRIQEIKSPLFVGQCLIQSDDDVTTPPMFWKVHIPPYYTEDLDDSDAMHLNISNKG